jgi:carboxypeptidase family protein
MAAKLGFEMNHPGTNLSQTNMRSLISLFLVVSVTFLGLAQADATAAANQPTGSVAGLVVDSAGNPVPGARVEMEIRTANGHVFRARTHTDRNGHFGIRQVPEGHGRIRSAKRGVGRGHSRLMVRARHTTRVKITLS